MPAPTRVLYLDVDDEITSAAARVRGVDAARVAIVIPPGSRVSTSRINFRLLARDATTHGRRLAIIAPDAGSRALAAAAGLEVFGSVAEYEAAMGTGVDAGPPTPPPPPVAAPRSAARSAAKEAPPSGGTAQTSDGGVAPGIVAAGAIAGTAAAAGATSTDAPAAAGPAPRAEPQPPAGAAAPTQHPGTPDQGLASSDTVVAPVVAPKVTTGAAPRPAPPPTAGPDLRPRSAAPTTSAVTRSAGRGVPRGPLLAIGLGIAAVVLLVGGVAAYLLLPSATVIVRPRVEPVPPVAMTVVADPQVQEVDVEAGVVPAETVTLDVQASGSYKATGERVVEAAATGSVRWTNCDPTASYTIKAGTSVRTRDRVAFTTDESVFLPVATIEFGPVPSLKCQDRDVSVTAAKAGPDGNVGAGAINVVPGSINSTVIKVTNPAPTSGGARETFPKVTQKDVDAAVKDLDKKLQAAFAAQLADPANTPAGTTLFPETASLGDPSLEVDPSTFVDQEVATFDLSAAATGTVTAVDEAPVSEVADARLRESIDAGHDLVAGSIQVTVGDGTVDGQRVRFPATATAQQVRQLDAAQIEDEVLGLTPDEAKARLAPYGDVQVELQPDWATTIPTYPFRVDVRIEGEPDIEGGTPSPAGSTP